MALQANPANGVSRPRLNQQRQMRDAYSLPRTVEYWARRTATRCLGLFAFPPAGREYIAFQFFHWVLDDEREAFRRQLQFLRRHGDIIGIDEAVSLLRSGTRIGGRYFCITFDDGFKNCFTNAAPVLADLNAPAAFFLPTRYIGQDLDRQWDQVSLFYDKAYRGFSAYFEFLTWDECRQMSRAGFTFGAHTHTHCRLSDTPVAQVREEFQLSKSIIERELARPCRHFCCPWGRKGLDYDPVLHPQLAREAGFESFLTTDRGFNYADSDASVIRRIGTEPEQGVLGMRHSLFASGVNGAKP